MKTKKYKALVVVIFSTIILVFMTKQVSADNIHTIYMDSVILYDTVYMCNIFDSIKVVPLSDCENILFWHLEYYRDQMPYIIYDIDTIYSDTLYIPADFNGIVDLQGNDGQNYCGKWIFIKSFLLSADDKSGVCGSFVQLNAYSNYYGSDNITFSWSPSIGLSDTTIPNPTARATGNMVYTVTLKVPNGCFVSKNVNVTLQPGSSPFICLVSVDSTNKNIIYWEKPVSIAIDSFFIYKETNVTNIYKKIGATGYDDKCFYIDTASYPLIQSNKYKISLKDSCGFESNKSSPHKTIHLTINQGQNNSWNLIWEPYDGFEISTYYIYRGTNSKNLQLIGSTSGSSTQYTDFTAPVGFVFYQIEVISPTVCNISDLKSTLTINKSRSNIATNSPSGFDKIKVTSNLFYIYPNPFNDKLFIEFKCNDFKSSIIELTDLAGKGIITIVPKSENIEINTNELNNGVYLIKMKTDKEIISQKIFKN